MGAFSYNQYNFVKYKFDDERGVLYMAETYIKDLTKLPDYKDCPEILRDYLHYIVFMRNMSVRTANNYYVSLRLFFRYIKMVEDDIPEEKFKDICIDDIDKNALKRISERDILGFLIYLGNHKNGIQARNNKLSAIKAFYDYLHAHEGFEHNPAALIDRPKLPVRDPKYLQMEEAVELLRVAQLRKNPERDYCITTLFLHCGMRLSELVSIDTDFIIKDTLKIVGKGNKERTVYLDSSCMEALESWLSVREGYPLASSEKALFVSLRTRKRLTARAVQNIITEELRDAGLSGKDLSTHKLRHTAATLLYEGGADILELKEILGHEHTTTTEIYTHLNNKRLQQVSENNPLNNVNIKGRK